MPTYDYICPAGHVTEQHGGYDDAKITCYWPADRPDSTVCGKVARRSAVYPSQGVVFKGTGFTRTVIPPAPPKTTTTPGEPVADWFEKTDEYAEKQYRDDEHYREDRKDQAKKMIKQVKRGALT